MTSDKYRGRFAPSPTGQLHFGSLVAAVASYADARHHDGAWLVRIDDVDETRSRPGVAKQQITTLAAFGMESDETPVFQSARTERYRSGLQALISADLAYRCTCSRRDIAKHARIGKDGPIYPGTCKARPPNIGAPAAWRFRVEDKSLSFDDRVYRTITQNLGNDVGDFVIFRLDGFCAYQLAVVLDDADQGITHVVRGADLLWSTPRQLALQSALGLKPPRYAHVPLVYGTDGRKLSKTDTSHPVDPQQPLPALLAAWTHLGQAPLQGNLRCVKDFWRLAVAQWATQHIPARTQDTSQ
jgi:glutamyl-Q tRNA(Asp) synthetase